MILYHGSNIEVKKPDIVHSREKVDFGRGFYTTPLLDQAMNWCRKFIRRGDSAFVSVYELDESALKNCKLLQFDSYSEEWLDFILKCRQGRDRTDFDIVIGGVANDKVFDTVELFLDGLINKEEAIGRLRFAKPNAQICFRSQESIDRYLHYIRSDKL